MITLNRDISGVQLIHMLLFKILKFTNSNGNVNPCVQKTSKSLQKKGTKRTNRFSKNFAIKFSERMNSGNRVVLKEKS